MQQSSDNQSATATAVQLNAPTRSWMDGLEIASVIASLGGTVAAVVMQQAAVAVIPLSLSTALNLVNRKRLINELVDSQQAVTTQLVQQDQQHQQRQAEHVESFQNESAAVKQQFGEVQSLQDSLSAQLEVLESQGMDLATVLDKLREIDRCTQSIRTSPHSAEFFLNRGEVRQSLARVEDSQLAIVDYTQAIELDPTLAKAYFNRGVLRAELGERRPAGEDLRMAAKCFFDQSDMDNYAEAKRLSEEIYEKFEQRAEEEVKDEKLRAADLFA